MSNNIKHCVSAISSGIGKLQSLTKELDEELLKLSLPPQLNNTEWRELFQDVKSNLPSNDMKIQTEVNNKIAELQNSLRSLYYLKYLLESNSVDAKSKNHKRELEKYLQ